MSAAPPREWSAILADAVAQPGVISQAYREFWNYSVGNQLLALFECFERKLPPGPIHTFLGWKEVGRHVKKGEKAITLCMPVTCKSRLAAERTDESEAEPGIYTRFIFRPNWFVLAQTEGADYVPTNLPDWREGQALVALDVQRVDFQHLDGNAQGYAVERSVAVSPVAFMPHRTLFHELAHVVLGHTAEHGRMDDGEETTPRSLREVEAEAVAMICCESLGQDGAVFSRGYIQHWLGGSQEIPERSAQKIFKAADQIIKAGRPETVAGKEIKL